MQKIDSDIVLARRIIDESRNEKFDKIYPFTNENILECFNNFNLKNKRVLSVLSSSDQVFDMYLKGSKIIDTFDLNPLTKYYFCLKKAAIKSGLSFEEYLDFFCLSLEKMDFDEINEKIFDKDMFNKISKNLDKDSYKFWNTLFNNYDSKTIKFNLFIQGIEFNYPIFNQIKYLKKGPYKKLQKDIENVNITFINTDIKDLPYKLYKQYDFMYFSNIIQYVDEMYKDKHINKYKNKIYKLTEFKNLITKLKPYLNDNGQILLGYLFSPKTAYPGTAIYHKFARNEIFNEKEYKELYFKSRDINSDACMVYTKK